MNLSELLNGGYNGLYGEVVTEDCYKLKELSFVPDVIFDLGSNVGVFTRYASSLFPNAKIISVEPNSDNYNTQLELTNGNNVVFIKKAIGKVSTFRMKGAINGAHEKYVNLEEPKNDTFKISEVESIMIDELISENLKEGQKSFLKLDIEGNENVIWTHKGSMEKLKKIDAIAMELHFLSTHWTEEDKKNTMEVMDLLCETHMCKFVPPMFYAQKLEV